MRNLRIIVAIAIGLGLRANSVHMLFDPGIWYALVPGVPETGPFNSHFVRDIGCAYLVSGLALAALALGEAARPAALGGALFLSLHAFVHLADAAFGHPHGNNVAADLAAVYAPAAIALWLALSSVPTSRRMPMLKWLLRRRLAAFEREFGYDTSYVREMLDADVAAVMALWRAQGMSRYRKGVPREAYYAAAIAGGFDADCGPCTQLVVTMAEKEGVAAGTLRAIITGDLRSMPDDAVLAYQFAKASLAREAGADELRGEIVKRWGESGLISLAFALASSRVYPTLKYALGHGKACTRLTVAGSPVPVLKQAA